MTAIGEHRYWDGGLLYNTPDALLRRDPTRMCARAAVGSRGLFCLAIATAGQPPPQPGCPHSHECSCPEPPPWELQ
jgi:hypothetical protein